MTILVIEDEPKTGDYLQRGLTESGFAVRLTGQDAGRGTFVHRHAVLHDQNREKWDAGSYIPLQFVSEQQAPFLVIDSVLS